MLLLFATSCINNSALEQALAFSGNNRGELEYVLKHYKDDLQKRKAAEYLIVNMPYYYSYSDPRLDSMKQTQRNIKLNYQKIDSLAARWNGIYYEHFSKVYDSHIITANYLIDNIDRAFILWKTKPWNKNLSFDEFCELLLPYKISDEPIENWRAVYTARYASILDSLYQGTDVVAAVNSIGEYLKREGLLFAPNLRMPHVGALFLIENRVGTCKDLCDFSVYLMRSLGIPVAVDSYRRKMPHSWMVVRDTTGLYVPFWLDNYNGIVAKRGATDERLKGKVFRANFAVQSHNIQGRPHFAKDVTSEYFGQNQVEITVNKKFNGELVYLAIYDRGWFSIDTAPVKQNVATFRNLEPNMIYITLVENPVLKEISHPFTITASGKVHIYTPNKDSLSQISLWRKVSYWKRIHEHLNETVGGCIELSDDKNFRKSHLIATLDSTTRFHNYLYVKADKKYRYIRYSADSAHFAQMAEMWVYDTLTGEDKIKMHVVDASPVDTTELLTHSAEDMIDDDVLSFYRSENHGGHITFDMGKFTDVQKILYIPRNDDNFIHPEDTYELFYQNGACGWCSLGQQTAQATTLIYNNAPKNAIFLLKNCSRGHEEEIFFMNNEMQIFK